MYIVEVQTVEEEIVCSLSDGEHWIHATFDQKYEAIFRTNRMRPKQIIKLMNYPLNPTLHIVRKLQQTNLEIKHFYLYFDFITDNKSNH